MDEEKKEKKSLGVRIGHAMGTLIGVGASICIFSALLALAVKIWTFIL